LDDCHRGSDVFPEWTRSWSRRAIIKQAIRLVGPVRTFGATEAIPEGFADEMDSPRRLRQLPPFERFVFAMSVLERYSVRECAALLKCDAREVEQTRIRALQLIAGQSQSLVPPLSDGVVTQSLSCLNVG
jgi:DNA-directed RNA polymerase specialized sigma24 family protein